jgi:hypothetical protein
VTFDTELAKVAHFIDENKEDMSARGLTPEETATLRSIMKVESPGRRGTRPWDGA